MRSEKITFAYLEESVMNHWFDTHHEDLLFLSKYTNIKEVDQIAIGVAPTNDHLLSWLNAFIDEKKQDGTLDALATKYLNKSNYQCREF